MSHWTGLVFLLILSDSSVFLNHVCCTHEGLFTCVQHGYEEFRDFIHPNDLFYRPWRNYLITAWGIPDFYHPLIYMDIKAGAQSVFFPFECCKCLFTENRCPTVGDVEQSDIDKVTIF